MLELFVGYIVQSEFIEPDQDVLCPLLAFTRAQSPIEANVIMSFGDKDVQIVAGPFLEYGMKGLACVDEPVWFEFGLEHEYARKGICDVEIEGLEEVARVVLFRDIERGPVLGVDGSGGPFDGHGGEIVWGGLEDDCFYFLTQWVSFWEDVCGEEHGCEVGCTGGVGDDEEVVCV